MRCAGGCSGCSGCLPLPGIIDFWNEGRRGADNAADSGCAEGAPRCSKRGTLWPSDRRSGAASHRKHLPDLGPPRARRMDQGRLGASGPGGGCRPSSSTTVLLAHTRRSPDGDGRRGGDRAHLDPQPETRSRCCTSMTIQPPLSCSRSSSTSSTSSATTSETCSDTGPSGWFAGQPASSHPRTRKHHRAPRPDHQTGPPAGSAEPRSRPPSGCPGQASRPPTSTASPTGAAPASAASRPPASR
jgi:hypothetical protein